MSIAKDRKVRDTCEPSLGGNLGEDYYWQSQCVKKKVRETLPIVVSRLPLQARVTMFMEEEIVCNRW